MKPKISLLLVFLKLSHKIQGIVTKRPIAAISLKMKVHLRPKAIAHLRWLLFQLWYFKNKLKALYQSRKTQTWTHQTISLLGFKIFRTHQPTLLPILPLATAANKKLPSKKSKLENTSKISWIKLNKAKTSASCLLVLKIILVCAST